jgi:hypothetical protein
MNEMKKRRDDERSTKTNPLLSLLSPAGDTSGGERFGVWRSFRLFIYDTTVSTMTTTYKRTSNTANITKWMVQHKSMLGL